jgi:hypothetical protein
MLGLVKVGRTLYRDEVEHINVYPLDNKIELLVTNGRYSRYTSNFSYLVAEFYALMPERGALDLLNKTLNIKLEQDSLRRIGAAVAQPYLLALCNEVENKDKILQSAANEPGFVEKRMQEIDASPNRDAILLKALKEGVEGSERQRTKSDLNVIYVEVDGTGVSGLPRELSNKGKNGGPATTFEVKIGVMFNQPFDSKGFPLLKKSKIFRDSSTQYMGTVEKVGPFTAQLDTFTKMHGIDSANQVVFLSDGALWLEKLRMKLFPNSIGIIDLFHARQHLYRLVDSLYSDCEGEKMDFYMKYRHLLDLGEIDQIVNLISQKITHSNKKNIEKQLNYFTENKKKMQYGLFRAAGLFIGSGVVESACKIIAEIRLNGSGMRWLKKNAAIVIVLRCAIHSGIYNSGTCNSATVLHPPFNSGSCASATA